MIFGEKEVLVVDCMECPFTDKFLPSSQSLSDKCQKCPFKEDQQYDRLRLKTKYFTKEYDHQNKLLAIEPFFIDVRFGTVITNVTLLEEYYTKTGAKVQIFQKNDNIEYIYFIKIPEINVSFNQLREIYKEVSKFEKTGDTDNAIVKRWYLEYGILEHLLFDEHILEVNINPPAYKTPLRIVHAKYDECVSNIYPTDEALNYFATRLKINTGRPLNRAQPQLDGEIIIEKQKARIAAIVNPFSIFGSAYSIRKHREKPWTLPLFMDKKAINFWFAGFMSLIITHGRTFLTAGPRGSGKTSLLGALILELLPKYRIITIEDTQELPIESYKSLGYDLVPLKVRSALLERGFEFPFDSGLRTSLRLGDSCLIIGEVRSKEAKVLYEAMRVGAMSNVVAGTIHGDSPYGVYDRVVNDLGVPSGSFKVTDVIIIVNQIKSPTGMSRVRRVMSVTEVLKDWKDEPKFQDLLVYNPNSDRLEPTIGLLQGKSVTLLNILSVSRGYKSYYHILKDLLLRGWAKTVQIKLSPSLDYLEAEYSMVSNILFTKLFEGLNPLESSEHQKIFMKAFTELLSEILINEKVLKNTSKTSSKKDQKELFYSTQHIREAVFHKLQKYLNKINKKNGLSRHL